MLFFPAQNSDIWPIEGSFQDRRLIFSGSLNLTKLRKDNVKKIIEFSTLFLLWALFGLGIFALVLSIWEGYLEKNIWFLVVPSSFNLIFWTCALTTLYLIAKKNQKILEQNTINIYRLTESSGKKPDLDIFDLFNQPAKKAWNNNLLFTQQSTNKNQHLEPNCVTLLLSLLEDSSVQTLFYRVGIDVTDISQILINYASLSVYSAQDKETLAQVPFFAFEEAVKLHNKNIDPLMLVCGLTAALPADHIIQAIFLNINLDQEELETLSSWIFHLKILSEDFRLFKKLAKFKPDNEINKGLTSVPTIFLNRFSQDLTRLAKYARLPLALGRGSDLTELFKLLGEGRDNIIIKGEAGSGRSTLINELAYKMASEQVPKNLQDKRLVRLEISGILGSGQKTEQVFIQVLKEAVYSGNIVLVIEDIHELAKTTSSSGLNLLEILINFMEGHNLTIFGTTTQENFTDHLSHTANLSELFTTYELKELTHNQILLACCIRASLLEAQNGGVFKYQAIKQAVELSDTYMKGLSQPQKAIAILVEASSRTKSLSRKVISEKLIEQIVSEKTHVPAENLEADESEKLLHLEEIMAKNVIGQKTAVTAVAEGLRRARSGLVSKNRPLASFLFLGPTGVGKTEVAKTLASAYFGDPKYLLRLDMSEYRGSDGLLKFLGDPNAKLDTPIVKHLKNYPFGLLLLDELEKAGPEILNLFLQILDDGRLTTGKGEIIDLTHVLIIATSNAGSVDIQEGIKNNQNIESIKTNLLSHTLSKYFPPELINRFDGVVVFSPLSQTEIEQVSVLQLQTLKNELFKKGIKVDFTLNVIRDVAKNAYDPQYGARPIRRYVQDHLESFVAKLLLAKKLKRGSEITIDIADGQYFIL